MSQRLLRVRELLKREIGSVIARDYDFDALVTVNDVDVTPDLRNGHVFLGIIGAEGAKKKIVSRLNHDHGSIQQRVFKRVTLKYSPKLHFKLDDSVERGVRTLSLIQELDAPVDDDDFEQDEDWEDGGDGREDTDV